MATDHSSNDQPRRYDATTSRRRPDRMSARKDQSGAWRNGTSFDLSDLETIMNVAFEAKEWMTAHRLKR